MSPHARSRSWSRLRGALSHAAARVIGSRFAKPIARVVLVAAGLVLLAVIGRASAAGAFNGSPAFAGSPAVLAGSPTMAQPMDASVELAPQATNAAGSPGPAQPALAGVSSGVSFGVSPGGSPSRGRASVDDPVVLNVAAVDDLRRLPGIGQKRADAILLLRARLGRFRAIEDLMKVKGIGRAMLKRLRPLVRLDPTAAPALDGGALPRR